MTLVCSPAKTIRRNGRASHGRRSGSNDGSKYAYPICGVCAQSCEELAKACDKHSKIEAFSRCADACRKCAQECAKLAKAKKPAK